MTKDYTHVASIEALQKIKQALEANGFKVEIVDTLEEAKTKVLHAVPAGSEVFTATSVTLQEAGLTDALNAEPYVSVRAKINEIAEDKKVERRRMGSAADYIVGSTHAVTEDGHVYIASNSGSQLSGYVYGASNVIWVVGAQKLVKDHAEAMERLETHTLPLEDERAKQAYGVGSQISKLLIYRKDPQERVTIVLVRQSVGY
jgi:hypothetical protein